MPASTPSDEERQIAERVREAVRVTPYSTQLEAMRKYTLTHVKENVNAMEKADQDEQANGGHYTADGQAVWAAQIARFAEQKRLTDADKAWKDAHPLGTMTDTEVRKYLEIHQKNLDKNTIDLPDPAEVFHAEANQQQENSPATALKPETPVSYIADNQNVSLCNYRLGMTFKEFQKSPPPDPIRPDSLPQIGGSLDPETHFGQYQVFNANFYLFPEPGPIFCFFQTSDGEQRLIRFGGQVKATNIAIIASALTKKYGEPQVNEPIDTTAHSHFEWSVGNSKIILSSSNPATGDLEFLIPTEWQKCQEMRLPVELKREAEQTKLRAAEQAASQQAILDRKHAIEETIRVNQEQTEERQRKHDAEMARQDEKNKADEVAREEKARSMKQYRDERDRRFFAHQAEIPAFATQLGTVGLRLDKKTGSIIEIFPGSDLEKSGCQPGDCITAVDGLPLDGDYLVNALLGKPDSNLSLTILHDGQPMTVSVVRHVFAKKAP